MKSMMRGLERRRRRRTALIIVAIAVPVLAAGIWLLFFNGGDKLEVTYEPGAFAPAESTAPVESIEPTQTPAESVLGVSTAEPTPQSTADQSDWRLLLVNPQHSLPDGFEVKLTELKNGQAVDERCYPDLQQMMDDCRAAGCQPLICSSFRSQEKQQELFDNKVNKLVEQGLTKDEAAAQAATIIAVPGTSEHQTGLAVDVVDINNQNMDETQEDTPTQQWMMNNSWRYGFIFRYPAGKTEITGISHESWHYRYVGKEAAQVIYEQSLCLEEYIEQLP